MGKSTNLKIGDSVIVKPNVKDPDLGIDIGGWQGRISEINADEFFLSPIYIGKASPYLPMSYPPTQYSIGFFFIMDPSNHNSWMNT